MDARVDAFECGVQKRLTDARPTDMSAAIEELAKFKANLLKMLEGSIPIPEVAPAGDDIFDWLVDHPHA